MSAVASFPSLSELMAWPTGHLTEAADYWDVVGDRSYGVAHKVWRDANSVDWRGETANALRAATHTDMLAVSAVADRLQAAAKLARGGAADLYAARSRVRYAVEEAQWAGFDVADDFSLIDRSTAGSAAQRAARHAEGEALAAEIQRRAAQLVRLDQQVAGQITAAVAGIRGTFPQNSTSGPPSKLQTQAVDNHTFKQDGPPPPGPPGNPFPGWTEEQKAEVATEIAHGHAWDAHKGDFPGMTQEDLARWIYDTMNDPKSRVATSAKSGGVALLRDGKIVFVDPRNPDYGTTYRPQPNPSSDWRTAQEYFERQTRALEPLPPPAQGTLPTLTRGGVEPHAGASPPEVVTPPAPRTAPSPPAAAGTAPPARVGEGPALGGGPAMPFGPQIVHPPHSIPHHFPILGEDNPNEDLRDFE